MQPLQSAPSASSVRSCSESRLANIKLFIIGAMKGGTTSLHHYLDAHPSLCGPKVKETDFFVESLNWTKGWDWYNSQFSRPADTCFEASPNYTKRHIFPSVPERIAKAFPNARFVYVIRDPIERAISHYAHNLCHGREIRSLRSAIKKRASNYILTSRYYYQLEAYLRHFDEKRILIVSSEKLSSNTEQVVRRILDFIGEPFSIDSSVFQKRHHRTNDKTVAAPFDRKLEALVTRPRLRHFIRSYVPKPLLKRRKFEMPTPDKSTLQHMKSLLADDVDKLRSVCGSEIDDWSI